MPDDIERIMDRKLIKQRVHYYVVWKGFGQENNTWESRIDLMADGYSDIIKRFEDQRKKESGSSTPRGRSPSRSTRRSKSPGRSRSRRSRSRSASVTRSRSRSSSVSRKLPVDNNEEEKKEKKEKKHKESPTKSSPAPQRRRSPRYKENNNETNVKETPRRRSTRHQTQETSSSTLFVSRLDEEDDSVLLRSTIAALAPQVREMTPPASSTAETGVHKKPVTLSYEEEEESVLLKPQRTKQTTTSEASATVNHVHEHASPAQNNGLIAKAVENGYLASVLSVVAVMGSLVASQMLPREAEESELWRRWLVFLTPVVALLLFFHQKDARASAKWVATGLAWRAAAELLLLISDTPREFEMMVAISVALANVSLLIAVVSILRNGEHNQSKSTLALLTVGILTLFLSDSWVISTENSELESRVVLMSMAVVSVFIQTLVSDDELDD
ncbi:chromodomain protein, putative [Phytophthora infestans T30-4]|uniref:Chromodomain protein, putative n=1 Tax=Phytophthora infestans (strain T30-4) TaxID=403677 RepID=D0MX27_PHYIT|nr:chromodomain protein, putative [Phytophthora infestans T30-4]EEY64190.1 chromodomain protein, putative [Phytophthora infestans T30-4]|eukprot:XP_002907626.1 chromodomain protein, putative [Phytophthora infestans T30-4]